MAVITAAAGCVNTDQWTWELEPDAKYIGLVMRLAHSAVRHVHQIALFNTYRVSWTSLVANATGPY